MRIGQYAFGTTEDKMAPIYFALCKWQNALRGILGRKFEININTRVLKKCFLKDVKNKDGKTSKMAKLSKKKCNFGW